MPETTRAAARAGAAERGPARATDVGVLLARARAEPPAAPALLLPLRLEYRVLEVDEVIVVGKSTEAPVKAGGSVRLARAAAKRAMRASKRAGISDRTGRTASLAHERHARNPKVVEAARLQRVVVRVPQMWVRWFPDDAFSATDAQAPSPDESDAIERYQNAVNAAAARLGRTVTWYDNDDAELAGEWQRLASTVGFFRAVQLMRQATAAGSASGALSTDPFIVGLPERVSVFALKRGTLTYLGQGSAIPDTIHYSPDALGPGEWLTDFDAAVASGMGVKLKGAALEAALGADWLIVTGLRDGDGKAQLERFIAGASAAGDMELLCQDTPTNNSARDAAGYEEWIRDPVTALRDTTYLERRDAATPADSDADVLAVALGMAPTSFYGLRNASLRGTRDARDMATALMSGLTAYFDYSLSRESVSGDSFRAFMAALASARGPLPALRIGENPYGVLPIALPGALAAPVTMAAATGNVFNFVLSFAGATIAANEGYAANLPILKPGVQDQTDALRRILQTLPVSSHLDVTSGVDSKVSGPVQCPLVLDDTDPAHAPAAYCEALLSQPLSALANPKSIDKKFPLLFRLLRLSLENLVERLPSTLRSQSARAALLSANAGTLATDAAVDRLRQWVAAVESIETRSRGELEVLMLEVIDLLDHRIDAWQTALATARLNAQRTAGETGLRLGYYGMLSTPRATSTTGATDGYVQAPSLAQAVTAGLLRSGALRHSDANGPFRVKLTSRRVRKALKTLDGLRKGLTIGEVLGYHAERWLHDEHMDWLLYDLRTDYSVRRGEGANATTLALLDGKRLLDAESTLRSTGTTQRRTAAGRLLDELVEQLDALSDLVVAEAVHQLAHGSPAGVSAWMKVLSGGAPPPESVFLKTHRSGHSSSYRAAFLCDVETYAGSNPRAIAEPLLAGLATSFMPDFADAAVRATISVPDATTSMELILALEDDLDMEPIDLLIGGESELRTRVRSYVLAEWQKVTNSLSGTLGDLPDTDLAGFLNQKRPLAIDLAYTGSDGPSASSLIAALAPLGNVVARSRPLTPADLNAASDVAEDGMDTATYSARYAKGITALRGRAQKIQTAIGNVLAALATDADAAIVQAREIRRRDIISETPGTRDRAAEIAALRAAKRSLDLTLRDVAAFGLRDALTPFTLQDLIDAPDGYQNIMAALQRQLTSKSDALQGAIDASRSGDPATAILDALTTAIQNACDGDVIRIWPPLDVQADTTPAVGAKRTITDVYGGWPKVRPDLRSSLGLSQVFDDFAARVTARSATTDPRKPAASHIAMYLLPTGDLPTTTAVGFVFDEWNDFRPSSTQTTGLAINYDSPQCEPPHVMLLAVAPNDGLTAWTDAILAGIVQEAIRLTRVRALASHTNRFVNLGLRAMNLVPPIPGGKRGYERIPGRDVFVFPQNDKLFGWRLVNGSPQQAFMAGNIIERNPVLRDEP